ncbi:uncharacterized protein L3040_007771 [Drepanopeziza brunnea f. sp. 'multigermtubi']|uniref:uncharacterized protein n=1 Tax=Drepanopeziza brunnea f. sp. 'multigermtubi' TaxID=698441 RepID=UPI002387889A|nr:hypothetical protein L3040_007771 [Drepanopeziza brunnea f. sp. 'multigermtubi']
MALCIYFSIHPSIHPSLIPALAQSIFRLKNLKFACAARCTVALQGGENVVAVPQGIPDALQDDNRSPFERVPAGGGVFKVLADAHTWQTWQSLRRDLAATEPEGRQDQPPGRGDKYNPQGPYGLDLGKLRDDTLAGFRWIWYEDMEVQAQRATATPMLGRPNPRLYVEAGVMMRGFFLKLCVGFAYLPFLLPAYLCRIDRASA